MLKEDTVTLPTHLLAPMNEEADLLDQQFENGWDAAVQCAFGIVSLEVGGPGHAHLLERIRMRFMDELGMKEDE